MHGHTNVKHKKKFVLLKERNDLDKRAEICESYFGQSIKSNILKFFMVLVLAKVFYTKRQYFNLSRNKTRLDTLFYRHAYGAKHHTGHRVQLNLLGETHTTRSVKYISTVLRYAVQLKTGDFHSGSHIKKKSY